MARIRDLSATTSVLKDRTYFADRSGRCAVWMHGAGWICVLAIIVLSLLPGEAQGPPDLTSISLVDVAQNFAAYFACSLLLLWGRTSTAGKATVGSALCVLSATMECFQEIIPRRVPDVVDFAVNSGGALSAAILSAYLFNTSKALAARSAALGAAPKHCR
jgi:VanZ family protein